MFAQEVIEWLVDQAKERGYKDVEWRSSIMKWWRLDGMPALSTLDEIKGGLFSENIELDIIDIIEMAKPWRMNEFLKNLKDSHNK